jgi:hypothetical protein
MKILFRLALASALLAAAVPATAGELHLTIANGRVTLVARDVTVREILAEWARVGQTRIVNGEKLLGGPVTLQLENVPEAQALDTLLRSAAGYIMAPRSAASSGPSVYDRIMILATSRAPAMVAAPPAAFRGIPQPPPVVPDVEPDDDDNDVNFVAPPPQAVPGMGVPIPGQNNFQQPPQFGQPGMNQPPAPMTAPRPGMLPAPPQPQGVPGVNPNPLLVPGVQPVARPGGGGEGGR